MKSDVHRPVDLRAFLICVVLSMIWGFQQTAIKASAPDIGPLMQVALRSGGAAFLLWCANRFWLREKWNMNVKFTDALKVGLGFAGEFFFVALGLQYTNASHISVLLYTAPFFAAIGLSIKLPEERLSAIQWAGLVTAFTGIATAFLLPVFLSGSAVPEGEMWLLGDFFGLMSGFCWGLTTISMRATTMNEAPASQMLFCQLASGFAVLLPCAILFGQTHIGLTPLMLSSMGFQTFVVAFASYLVWCQLLKQYLAARLGILVFMTPLRALLGLHPRRQDRTAVRGGLAPRARGPLHGSDKAHWPRAPQKAHVRAGGQIAEEIRRKTKKGGFVRSRLSCLGAPCWT